MKIIKNTMETPIEITCPECKSVLEYTYKDIERREDYTLLYGLCSGITRYIVCPVCKKDIDLNFKVELKEAENKDEKQSSIPSYYPPKDYIKNKLDYLHHDSITKSDTQI